MAVFVTVGTTKFDELVKAVTNEDFQKLLLSKGYSRLVIQLGNGEYKPNINVNGLEIEWYRLKPSLQDDMRNSSLIISHGGAGCILESLSLKKPLVAVINENLMDNHQMELSRQLAKNGHLVYSTCNNLYDAVKQLIPEELIEYTPGQPKCFNDFMDSVMGFSKTS